jgi:hypothetical protein
MFEFAAPPWEGKEGAKEGGKEVGTPCGEVVEVGSLFLNEGKE